MKLILILVALIFTTAQAATLLKTEGFWRVLDDNGVTRTCLALPHYKGQFIAVCFTPGVANPIICDQKWPKDGYIDCKEET